MTQQQQVVDYALSQVGYKETPSNITKYSAEIDKNWPDFYNGKKQGAAWCDIFVDYDFLHNFGEEKALYMLCQPKHSAGAGCKFSAQYYKNAGQWFTEPKVGDQIFFYDNAGVINHTGIVTKVDDSNVYTVEGNSGDAVKTHGYSLSNKKIAGYGRPRYDESSSIADTAPTKPQNPALKSEQEIANEVIAGKWGNGTERKQKLTEAGYDYDAIQKIVNQITAANEPTSKDTFTGIVNTIKDPLNVRSGAGMQYKIVKRLAKGSKVLLYKKKINGWYQLADGSGYVAGNLIRGG